MAAQGTTSSTQADIGATLFFCGALVSPLSCVGNMSRNKKAKCCSAHIRCVCVLPACSIGGCWDLFHFTQGSVALRR